MLSTNTKLAYVFGWITNVDIKLFLTILSAPINDWKIKLWEEQDGSYPHSSHQWHGLQDCRACEPHWFGQQTEVGLPQWSLWSAATHGKWMPPLTRGVQRQLVIVSQSVRLDVSGQMRKMKLFAPYLWIPPIIPAICPEASCSQRRAKALWRYKSQVVSPSLCMTSPDSNTSTAGSQCSGTWASLWLVQGVLRATGLIKHQRSRGPLHCQFDSGNTSLHKESHLIWKDGRKLVEVPRVLSEATDKFDFAWWNQDLRQERC